MHGGFFFTTFRQITVFKGCTVTPAAALDFNVDPFGAWAHFVPAATLTHRGRWFHISAEAPVGINSIIALQLGVGAAGSEIQWIPTDTAVNAFIYLRWQPGVPGPDANNPFFMEFPGSLNIGDEICVRAKQLAGANNFIVNATVFN